MHRIQIQLTTAQKRALRDLSRLRGQSISALVREGVDLLVTSGGNTADARDPALALIGLLGADPAAPTDVSENHDDYLDGIYAEKIR